DALYKQPRHPYTQALIAAVPLPDPDLERNKHRVALVGDLPSPLNPPSGCVFRSRCPWVEARCAQAIPMLEVVEDNHQVACHYWREHAGEG
ncbi:MAG: oligopeptide ABC transporter ATP-binding protein OppF, partial [Candidatus Competibacteraceae bacterium]|nr:oligopeptide ABC transporter ATP-binding protein OppF [Candidatus Competibacteraceae bacterium]